MLEFSLLAKPYQKRMTRSYRQVFTAGRRSIREKKSSSSKGLVKKASIIIAVFKNVRLFENNELLGTRRVVLFA